jgi:hypothetical protein
MFMSIVENRIISNRNHGSDLPASWRTLYELSRVDTATLERAISDVDARLWEISENLHRAELSVGERADQIAEWIRLTEAERISAQVEPEIPRGRGRPESGINAAARQLPGVDRNEAQRAIRIAGIGPEAREAARQAGLDDNQSALLRIAVCGPRTPSNCLSQSGAEARRAAGEGNDPGERQRPPSALCGDPSAKPIFLRPTRDFCCGSLASVCF